VGETIKCFQYACRIYL